MNRSANGGKNSCGVVRLLTAPATRDVCDSYFVDNLSPPSFVGRWQKRDTKVKRPKRVADRDTRKTIWRGGKIDDDPSSINGHDVMMEGDEAAAIFSCPGVPFYQWFPPSWIMRGTSTHLIKMTGIGLALRVLKVSRDQLLVLEMRSSQAGSVLECKCFSKTMSMLMLTL